MSTLAHVFEQAGLSTIVLASMRPVVEKMQPPRALYCEFPLGRPLGHPGDVAFQRDVLMRGFALLDEAAGPVLEDHPDVIEADELPMTCSLPPRFDPDLAPAIDEANGLRNAYNRALQRRGVTSVGRSVDADGINDGLRALLAIAEGTPWKEANIPGKNTIAIVHDIRSYYEEAALELVDGPAPNGRAAESWFYEETEAGRAVMAARRAMSEDGAPYPFWFYMAPAHR